MAMSHVALLAARYDRAIPPEALRYARELDAAGISTGIAWAEPAPPPPRFKSAAALIGKMARVMVDRVAASGACSSDDLAAACFTAEEIQRHGDAAKRIAARLMADRNAARLRAPRHKGRS
jgi:hypothetical protein